MSFMTDGIIRYIKVNILYLNLKQKHQISFIKEKEQIKNIIIKQQPIQQHLSQIKYYLFMRIEIPWIKKHI